MAMYQKKIGSLNLWQFDALSRHPGIRHYVSGRAGGVSEGELASFNLSFKVNDKVSNVIENRNRLSQAFDIDPNQLVFPSQTHSVNVKIYGAQSTPEELTETDAIITNQKGILISVMSADCVPILLYDPVNQVIGAVHAGWRGSVGKILTHTVLNMVNHFNTHPEKLIACIGPSICQEVYEVGQEVIDEVQRVFGNQKKIILHKEREDKGYINLWEINKLQLMELGVPETSIEIAELCTFKNADLFFSARKSGNTAGRFAAGIMMDE